MTHACVPGRPGADAPSKPTGFLQRLGLFDATMLVAGTMIGSGIFIVSADIARDVGSAGYSLLIWVLTGVITLLGVLSYAELASMMPLAGGQYIYLREAYSPLWGFLYGWTVFLVIQAGSIAAVGVTFAKYLGVLLPKLGTGSDANLFEPIRADEGEFLINIRLPIQLTPWLQEPLSIFKRETFTITAGQLVAVGIIVLLTWVNCRGVREGKWVQNIFGVTKTAALIVLIVLGLTVAANAEAISANLGNLWAGATGTERFRNVQAMTHGPTGLVLLMVAGGAMVGALFAADAWNNVTFIGGEIKNPRRNLPLSLVLGVGLVMVLYLLANLAYLADLPVKGTAETVGIDNAPDDRVATAALKRFGVTFMAVAIMISTFGCVNGMILMGARLYYAMARDGLFFPAAGLLNIRGVPAVGLILQGAWSILLVFSGTYSELLDFIMFAALLFYVLTVIGLFVLRAKRPDVERPYRVSGYPWLPGLYVLLCAVIMLDLLIVRPEYTWPGLILVLSGIPVYFLCRARFRAVTW